MFLRSVFLLWFLVFFTSPVVAAGVEPAFRSVTAGVPDQYANFPAPLENYTDQGLSMREKIASRAKAVPFNLIVTLLFVGAILHTFLAPMLLKWAHHVEKRHRQRLMGQGLEPDAKVSLWGTVLEFLGEVETVFAIWAIPDLGVAFFYYGWGNVVAFVEMDNTFTEAMFVVVIMAIAASRPVVQFAERALGWVAGFGKGTPTAWWLAILILAPLLGSFITEPGAMTIAALLLSRKIYELQPSKAFKYATLGLLFVNISVGGVLTNFAAPPVLMVASPDRWNWSSLFMMKTFGSHAVVAILLNTGLYFLVFRKQLAALASKAEQEKGQRPAIAWVDKHAPVPILLTLMHLAFLTWTVLTAHHPSFFIGGFLFFLGLQQATGHHQTAMNLRGPLMVGFFLAGLVIHGRLQGWWLEPVLSAGLGDWPLHLGAAGLTAFNDNALITFLASQVNGLSDSAKYAIMSGAIAGGGLTVIANAPNPAGQSLLKRYFPNGISPLGLFLGALVPTVVVVLVFMLIRF